METTAKMFDRHAHMWFCLYYERKAAGRRCAGVARSSWWNRRVMRKWAYHHYRQARGHLRRANATLAKMREFGFCPYPTRDHL